MIVSSALCTLTMAGTVSPEHYQGITAIVAREFATNEATLKRDLAMNSQMIEEKGTPAGVKAVSKFLIGTGVSFTWDFDTGRPEEDFGVVYDAKTGTSIVSKDDPMGFEDAQLDIMLADLVVSDGSPIFIAE